MPHIQHLGLFLLSGLLLNITPGADMLFIISRSAGQVRWRRWGGGRLPGNGLGI